MWYLNYCAPFIYDRGGSAQNIRYFFVATLAIQYIIYLFFIFKYKFTGQQIVVKTDIDQGNQNQEHLHMRKKAISYPGFGDRKYRLDQKQFKEWYLHYFGLHSVAVAGCIMYSPFPATIVFAVIHLGLILAASIMHSAEQQGCTKTAFYIVVVVMVVMDVLLLFSIAMGVGASGYDTSAKNCFLLQ